MTDHVPRPYDHFEAGTDAPVEPGVYRVVGVSGGEVTLLLVADDSGRRVHAGTIEYVDAETLDERFEHAADPDSGFSLSSVLDPFRAIGSALRYYLGL